MVPIFYPVFAGIFYMIGQVTAPKAEVSIVKDGVVTSQGTAASPILVVVDGQDVQVRGARQEWVFTQAPAVAPADTAPFYRDGFGDLTAACGANCHEHEHPWDK